MTTGLGTTGPGTTGPGIFRLLKRNSLLLCWGAVGDSHFKAPVHEKHPLERRIFSARKKVDISKTLAYRTIVVPNPAF
ncbi:hypothetical protein LF1_16070 [Rubripirellula obstinata]|uniref:Uncharacterized protein n=1 Tax=Rubripirellula obstinata TaxID=406547 RepID=A0A5B1CH65_9BACT|nr:hypothetical protein LF1_16070 [Rubripirellula obstinata]